MRLNKNLMLYNLHVIISRLGSKISSLVVAFYVMNKFQDQSLFYTILIFAVGVLPATFLTPLYARYIDRLKNYFSLWVLDIIAACLIMGVFFSLNSIPLVLMFLFLGAIVEDLTSLIDKKMFFEIAKESSDEVKAVRINNTIISFLSIISASVATSFITWLGYQNSLLVDVSSFIVGAAIYFYLYKNVTFYQNKTENNNEHLTISQKDIDFKMINFLFLCVVFITNLESPLIFNYLGVVRNLNEQQIGLAMGLFSLGMLGGTYFIKYIKTFDMSLFALLMVIDGLFSFLLSLFVSPVLIMIFYTLQGIFAMFMIISFQIYMQKFFSNSKSFASYQTLLKRKRSIILLLSYTTGVVLSLVILNSAIIFRLLASIEIVIGACALIKKRLTKNT